MPETHSDFRFSTIWCLHIENLIIWKYRDDKLEVEMSRIGSHAADGIGAGWRGEPALHVRDPRFEGAPTVVRANTP